MYILLLVLFKISVAMWLCLMFGGNFDRYNWYVAKLTLLLYSNNACISDKTFLDCKFYRTLKTWIMQDCKCTSCGSASVMCLKFAYSSTDCRVCSGHVMESVGILKDAR